MKAEKVKRAGVPVFVKALLLVLISASSVTAIMSVQSSRLIHRMTDTRLMDHSKLSSENLAEQSAGALRFSKYDSIEAGLGAVLDKNPEAMTGGYAFDATGEIVAEAGRLSNAEASTLSSLAAQAIATGTMQRDPSGFLMALPVLIGADNTPVGAIATAWSVESEMANIRAQTLKSWATSLIILAIGLAITALLMRRWVSRPLGEVTQCMSRVSDGELDLEIPYVNKGDEVGKIARALEDQRQKLILAQEADALAKKAAEQAEAANDQIARQQEAQQAAVEAISKGLKLLASGDLTCSIRQPFGEEYEMLRAHFNQTLSGLQSAMITVRNNAESIRNGAEDISQASDDLSGRTESQAATLEEAVAALDELTTSIKAAANGAKEVEGIVMVARSDADRSGEVVRDAVEAMTEIETSSNQIQQIIGVIDDIAFQTNLLALNAGVEAARAGEAGKGFAVVATEVRALAQRSSEAALEIKSLIGGASQQVERGVALVGRTGEALTSIVEQVNDISAHISRIASSAREQSEGLSEITSGMNQLDSATQQNAAMVEEATAATHTLKAESRELMDLVSRFKTEGGVGADFDTGSSSFAA
ncbi:methyl-accepting chemotaxis protein [Marinibacterium profundimaris]|uniref:methyl-accepting chemotaxis protein n=1 Tax=Marinibacterium profundimaris TaxID=1679460 RepID=UPI000B52872C|nr:HAMP domain-containing methyl-accepting chemotaxis protein [Marinibacterium profundimaris]